MQDRKSIQWLRTRRISGISIHRCLFSLRTTPSSSTRPGSRHPSAWSWGREGNGPCEDSTVQSQDHSSLVPGGRWCGFTASGCLTLCRSFWSVGQQDPARTWYPPPSHTGELTDLYAQVSPLLGTSQELGFLWLLVEFPL